MASITHGTIVSQSASNVSVIHEWNSFAKLDWKSTTAIILSIIVARFVAVWSYNLWFHPLANFPGPFLGRASLLYRFVHTSRGVYHVAVADAHYKYGPIVRIGPNELSFSSVESWKSLYGHPGPGREIAPKTEFYETFSSGFSSGCIGSERDEQKHSVMRKMLSPAFSQRVLIDQEGIISTIANKFVKVIGERGGPDSVGIDMTRWFEMGSFDFISEMAFGESFTSLDTGTLHFWPAIVMDHIYFITVVDNLRRIGWLAKAFSFLIPSSVLTRNRNSTFSRQQVEKRLSKQESRNDFVSLLVSKVRAGEVSKEEMAAHTSTIIIAGGETVSSTFSTVTYFLAQNPEMLQRLVTEIRTAFGSFDDINATAAQKLPYLQAVLNEGLRMFPPLAFGLLRYSKGFELHGYFIPLGTEVTISPWAIAHDAKYFSDPWEFKPERWLDPNSTDVREASRPFSLGPRDCIGRNFAWMELNLTLTKMLWRYDIELVTKDVDFLRDSKLYGMWWKPKLFFRFHEASH
ncbi:cytochrome P450 [Xylaria cf. heliscus]|nr:cytochrome P450 [Xylaria cf. heliscus]